MRTKSFMTFVVAGGVLAASAAGTVLTFDIVGLSNFGVIPDAYGDRVSELVSGDYAYGVADEGFTPNVLVSYTRAPESAADPSFWGSGYGDLVNVYFEDNDGFGQGEIVLTADPGYEVVLYSFDVAAYSSAFSEDPVINAIRVRTCSAAPAFEAIDVPVSETAHDTYDFSDAPIQARSIRIQFDSANLGGLSDDIAFDNIRFGQVEAPIAQCPADLAEPACVLDFSDVVAFLAAFGAGDPLADLAPPMGAYDFSDVVAFLGAFAGGCP